jgi:hypothetical protein
MHACVCVLFPQGEHEASLASAQSELQTLREEHAALLELAAGLEVEVERLRVKEVRLAGVRACMWLGERDGRG